MSESVQPTAGTSKTPNRMPSATVCDPIPRLQKLREDLLAAPYELCTRKAELLTEYFRKNSRPSPAFRLFSRLHYFFYRRSVIRSAQGKAQPSWQLKLNARLMRYYARSENQEPGKLQIKYARAVEYILRNMELQIYPEELIAGNASSHRIGAPLHPDLGGIMLLPELDRLHIRHVNPMKTEPNRIRKLKKSIFPFWFNRSVLTRLLLYLENPELLNTLLNGSFFILTQFSGVSHLTPDYPTVLRKGFRGILDEITVEQARINVQLEREKDTEAVKALREKLDFYEASAICAQAAIDYGRRWADYLEKTAPTEPDIRRRNELIRMAEVFKRVPEYPAETFHQALQSVFISHVMLHYENFQHGISFGRMDQYLFPYYDRDIRRGKLSSAHAVELIGCFLGKSAELLPLFFDRATEYFSGLSSASGITLGGQKSDGSDAVNLLSFRILEAYDQMRLRQPNLHVRYFSGTDPAFRDLCYRVVKKGGGMPAFFNDDAIIPTQTAAGIREDHARNFSIVGCAEWGSPGNSFPSAGAVFINMPMALDLTLHNGRYNGRQYSMATGEPEDIRSMDDLLDKFSIHLDDLVKKAAQGNNAIEIAHARHRPTPLLSLMVDGCVESGCEVNAGGARYNSTGCQGTGLADVADSLAVIEQFVFKNRILSLDRLVEILDRNFQGETGLRTGFLNKVPKYGEDEGAAETYAYRVSEMFTRCVSAKKNPRGGSYVAGFWTMTTHQGFGSRLGALPSGRLAGEPLAGGISPVNGWDRKGPTASMSAAAGVYSKGTANGAVLNQKLNPDFLKGIGGSQLLDGLIRGYFRKGGMQVQFNIIDPNVLLDAKKHPERHRDLVVRISGYSAYFNDLTEAMKDEIIERTLQCDC